MVSVGIVGATGYTALELIKILLHHPSVEITCVTSRENTGQPISQVHSQLRERLNLQFEAFDAEALSDKAEFAFCCLPHGASAETVMQLRSKNIKVVDFSADYRLSNLDEYQSWYGIEHPDRDVFGTVPYGLPEFFRDEIAAAGLVANPGCFPTSAILPLAPLLKDNLISPDGIIVDSKTGVSGAGRKPNLAFHYPECNESIMAYKVGSHRHQPEIDDILQRAVGAKTDCLFTPHLAPMDRGILSTIYADNPKNLSQQELLEHLARYFEGSPFVRVTEDLPTTKDVSGTNYCDITVRTNRGKVILVSCLDNLIKGASGAAVQNFNLMCGFDETTAL